MSRALRDRPDWQILDDHVPIGKVYRIRGYQRAMMMNVDTGESRWVMCGWDVDEHAWIPLDTMRLVES